MTVSGRNSVGRRRFPVVGGAQAKLAPPEPPRTFEIEASAFELASYASANNPQMGDDLQELYDALERGDDRFARRLRTASFVIALANALRALRAESGLNQTDLGRKLMLTQGRISQIENVDADDDEGDPSPSVGLVERFAHVCGYSLTIQFTPLQNPNRCLEYGLGVRTPDSVGRNQEDASNRSRGKQREVVAHFAQKKVDIIVKTLRKAFQQRKDAS